MLVQALAGATACRYTLKDTFRHRGKITNELYSVSNLTCGLMPNALTSQSVNTTDYQTSPEDQWYCNVCCLPRFSDSFFSNSATESVKSSLSSSISDLDEVAKYKAHILSY